MHTSLLHHLVKTINTKMKIIREQVQLIHFLLKIIFRSNLLDQIQSKSPGSLTLVSSKMVPKR
ncbi:hypothetical protein EB31_01258 [Enterococcus cecorum]|nr:hypothetical protein EB31_01258 [Enterococcus cecorum]